MKKHKNTNSFFGFVLEVKKTEKLGFIVNCLLVFLSFSAVSACSSGSADEEDSVPAESDTTQPSSVQSQDAVRSSSQPTSSGAAPAGGGGGIVSGHAEGTVVKGDKGDPGKDGAKGEDGKSGETGKNGEVGSQGAPGIKGDKGEKGDKGDKGELGASNALALFDSDHVEIGVGFMDPVKNAAYIFRDDGAELLVDRQSGELKSPAFDFMCLYESNDCTGACFVYDYRWINVLVKNKLNSVFSVPRNSAASLFSGAKTIESYTSDTGTCEVTTLMVAQSYEAVPYSAITVPLKSPLYWSKIK